MNRWWIDWSAAQTATSLEAPMRFRFIGGDESTMTRGAILIHVVSRGSYHRGWIAEMFFKAPRTLPVIDLPVFLRDAAENRTGTNLSRRH